MPVDRKIIEIITAANMAGVEQAKAGMLGLNASTLGLAAALGVLVFAGKSAIENTEAQQKAHKSLQQAADVTKESFDQLQAGFDAWAETNKRYIPDQYAAETALAAFVRAGANAKDAMRELNVALDLSTLRGMSLEDAQKNVNLALVGSARSLKALGITTDEYNAIMHDKLLTTEQKHIALLELIESKTNKGRLAQTDLSQSTNALNKDWQDISTKVGPPLLSLLTFLVGKADDFVTALKNLGENKDWNKAISSGLGDIQNFLIDVVKGFEDVVAGIEWIQKNGGIFTGNFSGGTGKPVKPIGGHRAAGGPVDTGWSYLVGERGPEMFTPSSSGSITPNGGGRPIVINLYATVADGPALDRFTNQIAARLSAVGGL